MATTGILQTKVHLAGCVRPLPGYVSSCGKTLGAQVSENSGRTVAHRTLMARELMLHQEICEIKKRKIQG
jgi:hypothetical protein